MAKKKVNSKLDNLAANEAFPIQVSPVTIKGKASELLKLRRDYEKSNNIEKYIEGRFNNPKGRERIDKIDEKGFRTKLKEEYFKNRDDEVAKKLLEQRGVGKGSFDKRLTDYSSMTDREREVIQNSKYAGKFLPAERAWKEYQSNQMKSKPLKEQFSADGLKQSVEGTPERFRLFPNAKNNVEDYVNPAIWVGEMAKSLGNAPKDIEEGNYGKAAMSVATPLFIGATAGLGAKTTGQFVNNLVNPLSFLRKPTKETVDFSKYLTQEGAVQARAERMLSQESKWVGQDNPTLIGKFKNAVKNHDPASTTINPNEKGTNDLYTTKVAKDAADANGMLISEANKSRVAAHETGHYYRNSAEEAIEWNKNFKFNDKKLQYGEINYLKGDPIREATTYVGTTDDGVNMFTAGKIKTKYDGNELRERAAQLKDHIAHKSGIPLNQDFTITKPQLSDAIKNYVKETGNDNNMSSFLSGIKNKGNLLKTMNKYPLSVVPAVVGIGAASQINNNNMKTDEYSNGGNIQFANGGGVNRFMKTAEYYEPTQGFKLDYNQLAAGVLAREDAYDTNAAEIDALDTTYFKGIEGIEDERAKELNNQMETLVGTIGDKYNGDLSKAGDAIRRAKQWQRSVSKEGSEGALINANLKAFNENVKELQKLEGYNQEQAKAFISKAHSTHNVNTAKNKEDEGSFSTYQRVMPNKWRDLHKQALDLAKEMPIDKWETDYGLKATGNFDEKGNPQFYNHQTGSTETRTYEELATKLMPVIKNDPENAAFLESVAGLSQWQMDQANPNRIAETQQELELKKQEFEILKANAIEDLKSNKDKEEIKQLQRYLGFTGKDVDGDIGPKTKQAIKNMDGQLEDDYTKESELEAIKDLMLQKAIDPAAKFFQVSNKGLSSNIISNKLFEINAQSKQDKLDALEVSTGTSTADPTTENYTETQKVLTEYNEVLKDQTNDLNDNFKTNFKSSEDASKFVSAMLNLTDEQKFAKYGVSTKQELNRNQQYINDNNLLTTFNTTYTSKDILENQNKVYIPDVDQEVIDKQIDISIEQAIKMGALSNAPQSTANNNPNHINSDDIAAIKKISIKIASKNGTDKDFVREIANNPTLKAKFKIGDVDDYGDNFLANKAARITDAFNGKVLQLQDFYNGFVGKLPKKIVTSFKDGSYSKTVKTISFEEQKGVSSNFNKNLLGDVFRFTTESVSGSTEPFIDVLSKNKLSVEDIVSNTSNIINGKIVHYINTEKDGKSNQFIRYSGKDQTSSYIPEINKIIDSPNTTPEEKSVAAVSKLNASTSNYFLNNATSKLEERAKYDADQRKRKTNDIPPQNYEYQIGNNYKVEYEVDSKYTKQTFRIKSTNIQNGQSLYIDFAGAGITNTNYFSSPEDAEVALGLYLRKQEINE